MPSLCSDTWLGDGNTPPLDQNARPPMTLAEEITPPNSSSLLPKKTIRLIRSFAFPLTLLITGITLTILVFVGTIPKDLYSQDKLLLANGTYLLTGTVGMFGFTLTMATIFRTIRDNGFHSRSPQTETPSS